MYTFQQSFISNCDMLIKCNDFHRTLHGPMRVRAFTQEDAHLYCSIEQVED